MPYILDSDWLTQVRLAVYQPTRKSNLSEQAARETITPVANSLSIPRGILFHVDDVAGPCSRGELLGRCCKNNCGTVTRESCWEFTFTSMRTSSAMRLSKLLTCITRSSASSKTSKADTMTLTRASVGRRCTSPTLLYRARPTSLVSVGDLRLPARGVGATLMVNDSRLNVI